MMFEYFRRPGISVHRTLTEILEHLKRLPGILVIPACMIFFCAVPNLYPYEWPMPLWSGLFLVSLFCSCALLSAAIYHRLDPIFRRFFFAIGFFYGAFVFLFLGSFVVLAGNVHRFSDFWTSPWGKITGLLWISAFIPSFIGAPLLGVRNMWYEVPAMIDALKRGNTRNRQRAATTLSRVGSCRRRWCRLTEHEFLRVRANAVACLRQALDDVDNRVRREAAWALQQLDPTGTRSSQKRQQMQQEG